MTSKNESVERREHKRYQVHSGTYVALGPPYGKVGPMIDISLGGVSFEYADRKERTDESHINIFLTEANFYLEKVPIRTILDFEISDTLAASSVATRRCGLRFEDLTPDQASQIDFFIQNYGTGEA
jgi:hypothetical protein